MTVFTNDEKESIKIFAKFLDNLDQKYENTSLVPEDIKRAIARMNNDCDHVLEYVNTI